MKKLLLLVLCALISAAATAQNIMVVEQKSGTTTEFNVDDIQRVYFKNNGGTDANPSNSVLSSRLKDKDGNLVFLSFVGSQNDCDENNGYGTHFVYDANGVLTNFGLLPESHRYFNGYFIDGQSYHSYSTLPEYYGNNHYTNLVNVNMILNGEGLVSKLSFEYKEDRTDTNNDDVYRGEYTLTYNSEKQLVKAEGPVSIDDYDKDGNLRYSKKMETLHFTWEDGNLVGIKSTHTEIEKVGEPDDNYPFSMTINYGNDTNTCKQYTKGLSEIRFFWGEWGIEELFMLGLFGVGPVNLPTTIDSKGYTYTLNENGTIASEKCSDSGTPDVYIYK